MKQALDAALIALATNLNNWYKTELLMLERNPPEEFTKEQYITLYEIGGWYADPDRERPKPIETTG